MAGVAGAAVRPEAAAPGRSSYALNWKHVRTLLWLRWKLTLRGYTRNWQQIVGLVFLLLFLVPSATGFGVATALGYIFLPPWGRVQLLFAILAGLWLFWAVLPLLQYTLNEGLDVTKLATYPLTRGEQMVSLVLATLMDIGTIAILALFIAIVVGWHASPLAVAVTVVALALAYVHIVGFSQLILAALMGLLASRRYRDLAIIFFALFGLSCSLVNQLIAPLWRNLDLESLQTLQLDRYLQWTPPGMAARAIVLADQGNYAVALLWLAALAVLVPVLLVIWARVLEHGITTAESASESGGRQRRRRARVVPTAGRAPAPSAIGAAATAAGQAIPAAHSRRGLLSAPALAITEKDFRYFWRDPQIKASLLSSLFVLIAIFVPQITGGGSRRGAEFFSDFAVLFAPLPALIIVLNLSLNAFGLEREGVQTLFLFPVRPLDVFWGKNLAVATLALSTEVVLTLGLAALSGGWSYVPMALVGGFAATLVMMGCGNVTSVLLPMRVRQMRMGRGSFSSSEGGCLRSIISMGAFFATTVLLLPVFAAVLLPLIIDEPSWLAASLPLSALYGIALHQIATRLIAPQLHQRAPYILNATVPET
jgi:ABC-2 type transport system permease protein